jgi:phosphoribosylanthranilate isomerase
MREDSDPIPSNRQSPPLLRKVCGMRAPDNIAALLNLEPDFLGFIFYPGSSRYVGESLPPAALQGLPGKTKKVGVFVNAGELEIGAAVARYQLEAVQLHGEEKPDLCRQLRKQGLLVFKAFPIDDNFYFESLKPYEGSCDFYLFDTKGLQYGGNGTAFNWDILKNYTGATPFFLSGGIGPDDAGLINSLALPALKGVDINSRFEISPALKDVGKVASFFKELN